VIGKLRQLVTPLFAEPEAAREEESLDLAVAVLLVEMARADHKLDAAEEREIQAQLEEVFGLPAGPAAQLLSRARVAVEDAVSLHEFTRAIHEGMDYAEKQRVIEMLWQVALADRSLDKYEDYLIGKLGELLYVSRGDVIRLKHRVTQRLAARDD
jgi:uncharacterized tellurite resistance protein B-like protein